MGGILRGDVAQTSGVYEAEEIKEDEAPQTESEEKSEDKEEATSTED